MPIEGLNMSFRKAGNYFSTIIVIIDSGFRRNDGIFSIMAPSVRRNNGMTAFD
jgi:hypothetical protein